MSVTEVNDPKPQACRGKYYEVVGFSALLIAAFSKYVLHIAKRHVMEG